MPPQLAALSCLLFVTYLFWNDVRKRGAQRISWAPLIWMFLAGSRYVSSWLSLRGPMASVEAYAEGSPVDRAVFFSLILWGAVVLARRNIDWARLLTANKWVALYLLYSLSSLLWSDEPTILAKRWLKDLGSPIMALVLLTEQQPYEAVGITLRRLSFLLLPLSALFVRYYPELGRTYKTDGTPMFTGVGHQKNDLGLMCLVTGMYFAWHLLKRRPGAKAPAERGALNDVLLIGMLAWLLRMSDSQTSIACLAVAIGVLLVARIPQVSSRPSQIVPLLATGALVFAILQRTFGIKDHVLALMGRNPTLTNRTNLWEVISSHAANPLVGAGFMSFWTGERMAAIWKVLGAGINQAHNGYLEQYLNLGYVGVAFIIAIVLSALLNVRRQLDQDPAAALLRLCFLVAAVMYNYTEASFYGMNNMWVLLLTASIVTTGAVHVTPLVANSDVATMPSTGRQKPGRWRVRRRRPHVMEPSSARPTASVEAERAIRRWTGRAAPPRPLGKG